VYSRVAEGRVATGLLDPHVPRVTIAVDDPRPIPGQVVRLTADTKNLSGPTVTWDVDADGTPDGTGPTLDVPIAATPRTVAVRAADAADGVDQRVTIAPIDASVAAAVPPTATEGRPLVVSLAPSAQAAGRVVLSGFGGQTAAADVPAQRSVALAPRNDGVWAPPRVEQLVLATQGKAVLTTAKQVAVTVRDDDRPRLTLVRSRALTKRRFELTVRPPAAGRITATVRTRGGSVLASKKVTAKGTKALKVRLTVSRSKAGRLKGRRPSLRASWAYAKDASTKASFTRTGPKLKR
jgi:hypothetical protein